MTQNETVIELLRDAGGIGIIDDDARRVGIHRLAARVHELKAQGLAIESRDERNRAGRGKHARYVLRICARPGCDRAPVAGSGTLHALCQSHEDQALSAFGQPCLWGDWAPGELVEAFGR